MTAAQSSQGAPPPPVTSQKAGAVQGCPYKAKPPCDVTKLVVTATVTAKPPVVRQLAVTDVTEVEPYRLRVGRPGLYDFGIVLAMIWTALVAQQGP